jgi:hypothetical protein
VINVFGKARFGMLHEICRVSFPFPLGLSAMRIDVIETPHTLPVTLSLSNPPLVRAQPTQLSVRIHPSRSTVPIEPTHSMGLSCVCVCVCNFLQLARVGTAALTMHTRCSATQHPPPH